MNWMPMLEEKKGGYFNMLHEPLSLLNLTPILKK